MKCYLYALLIFIGMSCNTSSTNTNSSDGNFDFSGFEKVDIGNNAFKITKFSGDNKLPYLTGTVLNGEKNGTWSEHWSENGRIKTLSTYVNGKKNGVELEFNNRGQIETKTNYANDLKDGFHSTYKFGRTELICKYKNGKFHGDYKEYFKSGPKAGNIEKLIQFKDGVQDGKIIYYNEEGTIVMEYLYKNGEKISGGITKR